MTELVTGGDFNINFFLGVLLHRNYYKVDNLQNISNNERNSNREALFFNILNNDNYNIHNTLSINSNCMYPVANRQVNSIYIVCYKHFVSTFIDNFYKSYINNKQYRTVEDRIINRATSRKRFANSIQCELHESSEFLTAYIFNEDITTYSASPFTHFLLDTEEYNLKATVIRVSCNTVEILKKLADKLSIYNKICKKFFFFTPRNIELLYLYDQIFDTSVKGDVSTYYTCIKDIKDPKPFLRSYSAFSYLDLLKYTEDMIGIEDINPMPLDKSLELMLSRPVIHIHYILKPKSKEVCGILINCKFYNNINEKIFIYNTNIFNLEGDTNFVQVIDKASDKIYVIKCENECELLEKFIQLYAESGNFPFHITIQSDYKKVSDYLMIRMSRYKTTWERLCKTCIIPKRHMFLSKNALYLEAPISVNFNPISVIEGVKYVNIAHFDINNKLKVPIKECGINIKFDDDNINMKDKTFFTNFPNINVMKDSQFIIQHFNNYSNVYSKKINYVELYNQKILKAKILHCSLYDLDDMTPMKSSEYLIDLLYLYEKALLRPSVMPYHLYMFEEKRLFDIEVLKSGGLNNCSYNIYRSFSSYFDFKSFFPSVLCTLKLDFNSVFIFQGHELKAFFNKCHQLKLINYTIYNYSNYKIESYCDVVDDEVYLIHLKECAGEKSPFAIVQNNTSTGIFNEIYKINGVDFDDKMKIDEENSRENFQPQLYKLFVDYLIDPKLKYLKKDLNALIGCINCKSFKYYNPHLFYSITFLARRILLFVICNIVFFYERYRIKLTSLEGKDNFDYKNFYIQWSTNDIPNIHICTDGFLVTLCRDEKDAHGFTSFINDIFHIIFTESNHISLKNEFNSDFVIDLQPSVYVYKKKSHHNILEFVSNSAPHNNPQFLNFIKKIYMNKSNTFVMGDLKQYFNASLIACLENIEEKTANNNENNTWKNVEKCNDAFNLSSVVESFYLKDRDFKTKIFNHCTTDTDLSYVHSQIIKLKSMKKNNI